LEESRRPDIRGQAQAREFRTALEGVDGFDLLPHLVKCIFRHVFERR
jgi:hypothetical protein